MNRQLELYTSAKDAHFGCKCVPKRMTGPFRTGLKYSEYTGLKIQRVHWQRQIRALCLREAVAPFCKSRHWTYCRHLFKLLTPIFRARSSCSPTSAFRAIFSIYLYLYIYIYYGHPSANIAFTSSFGYTCLTPSCLRSFLNSCFCGLCLPQLLTDQAVYYRKLLCTGELPTILISNYLLFWWCRFFPFFWSGRLDNIFISVCSKPTLFNAHVDNACLYLHEREQTLFRPEEDNHPIAS